MKQQNNNPATPNKWLADIPLSTIISDVQDTSLNLTTFSIPQIQIGGTPVSYFGDTIELPSGVINPDDKSITFNYILSSDWSQYINLHKWVSLLANVNSTIDVTPNNTDDTSNYVKYSLPIRVYILDEYKNIVISIIYKNCWISDFSEISLGYADDPEAINHSFTIKYSGFEIEESQ